MSMSLKVPFHLSLTLYLKVNSTTLSLLVLRVSKLDTNIRGIFP